MHLSVNPEVVAREMIRRGIDPQKIREDDFGGWTDTLIDSVEFLYSLESKVREEIKTMTKAR